MKKYTLTIEIEVSENWIEDGFDPKTKDTQQAIEEKIKETLPYAYYDIELKAKVINVIG